MEHNDNEQRLRILQERLGQIKNKQEAKQQQPKIDNNPPYPTYNPRATESSEENVAPTIEQKERKPIKFPWKFIKIILILGALSYSGFYLYNNVDFTSLIPSTTQTQETVIENSATPLQYALDFGEAKHPVIIGDFAEENTAIELVNSSKSDGYDANYFYLPSVSNSTEQVYQVYLGPYFSASEAKQWAGTINGETEILSL